MASPRGETNLDPICVDAIPDVNRRMQPSTKPSVSRRARTSNRIPPGAVVLTLSDDDSPTLDPGDLEEVGASSACSVAQKKNGRSFGNSDAARDGPSGLNTIRGSTVGTASRTHTAQPGLPASVVLPGGENGPWSGVESKEAERTSADEAEFVGPRRHYSTLSHSHSPSHSPSPSSSPSPSPLPSPSHSPSPSPTPSWACFSEELSTQEEPIALLTTNSLRNQTSAAAIPNRSTPIVLSPTHRPVDSDSNQIPDLARLHDIGLNSPNRGLAVRSAKKAIKTARRSAEDHGTRRPAPRLQNIAPIQEVIQVQKSLQEQQKIQPEARKLGQSSGAAQYPSRTQRNDAIPSNQVTTTSDIPKSSMCAPSTDCPSITTPALSVDPFNQTSVVNARGGTMTTSKSTCINTFRQSDAQIKDSALQARREEAQLIGADSINIAHSAVQDCLKLHLGRRHKTHAYLTEAMMKDQRRCQEHDIRAQRRQRKGQTISALPQKYLQPSSPFADLSVMTVPFDKKSTNAGLRDISQEIFTKAKSKEGVNKSAWVAPTITYKSGTILVPRFKQYISLKDNILVDNDSKLLATPYFPDEDLKDRTKLLKALPKSYEMKHDKNALLDFRAEQCRFYRDSLERFLHEIDVSWNDILYWLLASNDLIKDINDTSAGKSQFEGVLFERSAYGVERFLRDGEIAKAVLFDPASSMWQGFFLQLKRPSARNLRLTAILCAALLKEWNFSVWHLAQQSEIVRKYVQSKIQAPIAISDFTYRRVACVVCYQHNCLLHGELREEPESERKETKRSGPAHLCDDAIIERAINYKLPSNPDAIAELDSEMFTSKGHKPPEGKFNSQWWQGQGNSFTLQWEKRGPFFPCNHEGSCDQAKCRCYRESINCEKTCRCSQSCNRRFPGCNCARTPGKRVCAPTTCLCIKFNRECDANLCNTCGAGEVLDPVNRYKEETLQGRCSNVAIQRGVPRKTLLGNSEVHGFGLYMGEDIKKDDYIGEYKGETISNEEGERRHTIYKYQQTMYQFQLNMRQEVDATLMGNKLRFINNAEAEYTNCYARVLFCNTVFRLALYASVDMKAGTELFFDYHYPDDMTQNFRQPTGMGTAKTKQTGKRKARSKFTTSSKSPFNLGRPVEPNPRMLAATAKARAAKAEKHAARLAEQALQNSITAHRTGPQSARKTAPNNQFDNQRSRVSQLRDRRARTTRESRSRDASNASDTPMEADDSDRSVPQRAEPQEIDDLASDRVVEETDDEDAGEVVLQDSQETGHGDETPDSKDEDSTVDNSKGGRIRRNPPRSRSVAATNENTAGIRPGAGGSKKRKRPGIFDYEEGMRLLSSLIARTD